MSIKLMTRVFNDESLKPTRKLILLALADNSNDSGVCFPNINTIIKKTSLSRQSVIDNIKQLVEDGYLFKKYRNRKNGSRTSNKYLLFPQDNQDKLDEEDYLMFEDCYTQSQRDVPQRSCNQSQRDVPSPPTQSQRDVPQRSCNQSQRDVPSPPTQSQRDVPLESSLNTNHHLYVKYSDFSLPKDTLWSKTTDEYKKAVVEHINNYIAELREKAAKNGNFEWQPKLDADDFILALESKDRKQTNFIATYKTWLRR